jgi:AcrR family transcriptional regulator
MARPVNADAQATQAKILATAYELFAAHGIDGASIRDIARGATVSLAMVHHYFGSKQGLYDACVQAMLGEFRGLTGELEGLLSQGGSDAAAVLAEAVRVGFRYARKHRTAVRLLQRSLIDTGENDARVRDENMLPFLDKVSALLGGITGKPAPSMRLPLQSSVFLIVRYAITSERELGHLVGDAAKAHQPRADTPVALVAVEEHLVDASLRLLGMPPRPEPTA